MQDRREEMKNTENKEREKVRLNKELLFSFTIVLQCDSKQCDSTFRIALYHNCKFFCNSQVLQDRPLGSFRA